MEFNKKSEECRTSHQSEVKSFTKITEMRAVFNKWLLTKFTRSRWIASNSPQKRGSFRSKLSSNRNNTFLRSSRAPRVQFQTQTVCVWWYFGGSNFFRIAASTVKDPNTAGEKHRALLSEYFVE